MDVLITGVTGYIGTAVAEAIHSVGHSVYALAHSTDAIARVRNRGWHPAPGDLRDTEELERSARYADAVIHAGNTGADDAALVDTEATRAFLRALNGSGKPFLYTSGAWVLGAGTSDESAPLDPPALVAWRAGLETEVRTAPGIRGVVIRPGIVFGRGGGIPGMIARAELPIVGAGTQRWPLVHIDDLADLYVRALHAPGGAVLHGVSASHTMRELALLGAAKAHGPTPDSLSIEEARMRLGSFADALALDQYVSSRKTRDLLEWHPRQRSVIEEFLEGSYAHAAHAGLDVQAGSRDRAARSERIPACRT
jgi:nucleoside-diphosphate-sugar epimerase